MYCMVKVDDPCSMPPAVVLRARARTTPRASTPLCSRKRASSIAMIAWRMTGAMLFKGTSTRFW